ncbi:MAG: hypothetical protein KDD25_03855 [Bdellovibrionales bacterium]|nr:hypothetical protein [Bdellovibrionales bacterium]
MENVWRSQSQLNNSDINLAGTCAGFQSVTEVGLGSVLHGYKVPLSGQLLSLNQGLLLSFFTKRSNDGFHVANWSSLSTSALKSLSPIGKRLTPMLAITAQGFLFSLGVLIFGNNRIGRMAGMTLLGLWAFVQPIAIYMLVFGEEVFKVTEYFQTKLAPVIEIQSSHLISALLVMIAMKTWIGLFIVIAVEKWDEQRLITYQKKWNKQRAQSQNLMNSFAMERSFSKRLQITFKDLLQPWFLVSISTLAVYLYATDSTWVTSTWLILRTLSIALFVFYTIRFAPIERWISRLNHSGPLARTLALALELTRR